MPRGGKKGHKGRGKQFSNPEEIDRQMRVQREMEAAGGEKGSGSESEEESSSDDDSNRKRSGVEGLIEIENPNRVSQKSKKVAELDVEAPKELSRREREEIEKQKSKERYMKLHLEGKTDQARADLARLAIIKKQREDAAKKRDELKKEDFLESRERSIMLRQSLSLLKQLGSGGKSNDAAELLHEDLIQVDQRVEPAKKAAHLLHKKLLSCMQSQSGVEAEKRMKKLPLMQLSVGMAESLKDFDADSSIRRVLEMCCFLEKRLAHTLADFEVKVEKDVLEPLNKLSEEDLPDILKNRQHFVKLTRDWNNARIRSQTSTGAQAKQEGLREELEEAWKRLESIKDQYSADLYHFASKEDDYANYFIRLLELQAEYYRNSFEFLDKNIRELRENHSGSSSSSSSLWQPSVSSQRVYGEPLLSHLSLTQRDIAAPIQECIHMLLRTGMREEGLFRLAAAASVVKRLKTCLDHGAVDHSEFSMDPHAVAGALKSYLRELPEPLMTFELYGGWFKAAGEKEPDEKLKQFRELLEKLPKENYNNLRFLVQFLSLLSEQQAVNKMTPSNIAIVLGPNLLWPLAEGEAALFDMAAASSVQVVTVIEPLIQNCSLLFPEEVSFEVPDVPECPADLSPPASGKEKLSRTFSSTSSASSCSSYHTALSKTNSSASQDSTSFFIPKSGSISRSGTSSWAGPTSEAAEPQNQSCSSGGPSQSPSPALSSSASASTSASASASTPGPTQPLLPRTQAPNSGHNQSSEQAALEPILEATPNSPRGFVKITSPFKPKRSFVLRQNHHSEQPAVQFSKTPGVQKPAPHAPLRISRTQPTPPPRAPPDLPKAPLKKPGIKAPKCPPPLPPPSQVI